MQEWTNLKLTLKGIKKRPLFSIIILLGGLFMTLKELLYKLNVGNSDQYAILKARFVDKDGYTTDFTYKGFPCTIAKLLKYVPAEILEKGVIDFTFNGGSNGKYYSVNQDGAVVRVAYDIVIEY